ncbi:MAG: energy-coupling factor transporter transmembrane component T [Acidobacteriota bacterium]
MDLYVAGTTLFHRLHPGAKILGLLLLFVAPVVLMQIREQMLLLLLALLLAAMTGSMRNLRRLLPFMLLFFILTVAIWAVFKQGGIPIFEWHFLRVSSESVAYGTAMGIRLLTLMILGLSFLTVTPVEEFSQGCQSLGMGYRMSFALSLSFRLVPLFFSTVETVVLAQKSRGFDLARRNVFQRIRGYFPLFVPIISQGLRDADGLAMALECRGFGAGPRSSIDERSWNLSDAVALIAAAAIVAACVWRRITSPA